MSDAACDFVDAALRGTCAIGVIKTEPWRACGRCQKKMAFNSYADGINRHADGHVGHDTDGTADYNRKVALKDGTPRHVRTMGTGFFLKASTGLLLTAEHVRRDCRAACNRYASEGAKLVVCPYLGGELDWSHAWEAEVVAHTGSWDPSAATVPEPGLAAGMVLPEHVDAALLRPKRELMTGTPVVRPVRIPSTGTPVATPSTGEAITTLRIGTAPLKTTQVLYALGFPAAGGKTTPTPIQGNYSLDDTSPIQATGAFLKFTGAEILPGHSGGPIVTDSGVCVAWSVRKGGMCHVRRIEAAKACIELALPPGASWAYLLATNAEESAHATAEASAHATVASAAGAAAGAVSGAAAATQAVAGPVSDAADAFKKAQQAAIKATAAADAAAAATAKALTRAARVRREVEEQLLADAEQHEATLTASVRSAAEHLDGGSTRPTVASSSHGPTESLNQEPGGQGDHKWQRFSLKCARAQAIDVPEVLITAESQPATQGGRPNRAHLANVDAEATAVQAAFGGAANAELQRNISVSELDGLLVGRTVWWFAGHGGAPVQSETTLAFVGADGAIETVSVDALINTVRPHLGAGKLELIVLNADLTTRLAAELNEQAFVIYWETLVYCEAAQIFGTALARSLASGAEPPDAFKRARAAVCMVTEPGHLDSGLGSSVQKFELDVDPNDRTKVHPACRHNPEDPSDTQHRMAIPTCYHACRLLHYHPGARRGRLAAGTPKLLRYESTALYDVPTLPAHYMPRPEQWDLRAALVNGVRGDGMVLGIVGASSVTGIAGTAGLGKTTTANWLALDPCVRSAFRDGVFWLEFRLARSAPRCSGWAASPSCLECRPTTLSDSSVVGWTRCAMRSIDGSTAEAASSSWTTCGTRSSPSLSRSWRAAESRS